MLSERSGQKGLSKLGNPAQMADYFYGIPATTCPFTCFRPRCFNNNSSRDREFVTYPNLLSLMGNVSKGATKSIPTESIIGNL